MLVNLSKNVYFKWNRNGQFVDLVIWQFFVLRGVLSFLLFNVNMAERVINCQRVVLSKKMYILRQITMFSFRDSVIWQIFWQSTYSPFFSVQCKRGERWLGGEFISAERVVIWSDDGKAYLYKLPTNCIVESKAFNNRSKTQAGGKALWILGQ